MTLCSRLSSQPQIASAYTKQAPLRCTQPAALKAALLPLQVDNTDCVHVSALHMLCRGMTVSFSDVAVRDCQLRRITKPCKDAQNRLLWRDINCLART